jgi:hypothetical protein
MFGSSGSTKSRVRTVKTTKPPTTADGAGTTSGRSLAAAATSLGFNSMLWMVVVWLLVVVVAVFPFPWW